MTTTATRAGAGAHSRQIGRPAFTPAQQTTTGLAPMIGLVLRRNWVRLAVWVAVIVGLVAFVAVYYADSIFLTPEPLQQFAQLGYTPSMKALTGSVHPEAAAATLGGAVVTKIWMTAALTLALGIVFLVTRNGRADEELGRTELLRSRVLGLHAYTIANYLVAAALITVIGLLTALACLGTVRSQTVPVALGVPAGQVPVAGSLLMGASIAGVAFVGLGVAALAGQLASTSRGANALAAGIVGVFYVIRMYGDLYDSAAIWFSPIGWGEKMGMFGLNSWVPLIALVLLGAALIAFALWLEARRDLSCGLLPDRPGRASAGTWMGTSVGLALRLQRGAIIGWSAVVLLAAAMFGSIIPAMTNLLADSGSPAVLNLLRTDSTATDTMVKALISLLVLMIALIVTAFALQSMMQLRADEVGGTLEPQLAGAMGRIRWALGRLAIPVAGSAILLCAGGAIMGAGYGATIHDPSQTMALAGAALTFWPAVMVLTAVGVALFGWFPRLATPVTWGLLGLTFVMVIVGDALKVPDWVAHIMPLTATPAQPKDPMDWAPVLTMAGIAIVLSAGGLFGWRRRDLTSA